MLAQHVLLFLLERHSGDGVCKVLGRILRGKTMVFGNNRMARLALGAALWLPLSTPSALAQAVAGAGEAASSAELQDIIVTAQRRAERLQSVPIAITALSSDNLVDQGVTNLEGISQITPSLSVASYPNSSDTLTLNMRGQGIADAGQITKDGGVGLYIDGFYIARPQGALFDIGTPERVEVLRGPQGTLYGRNTTGGALNIITKKPTGKWGGGASVEVGSRDLIRTLADIDLPAFGTLAVRGSIAYVDQDGWVKNPGAYHRYGEFGQLAGRIAARWTPTDNLTVDYAWDRGRVSSTQPYYVNPDLEGAIPGYVADRDETYAPLDIKPSKTYFVDHQLTLNWDVSDAITLRSLSAYRGFKALQNVNYGLAQSTPEFPVEVVQFHRYRTKQYSQEFQIIGSAGERFEYTGGLYYFRETGTHFQRQDTYLVPFDMTLPTTRLVSARNISYAAYLQATYTPPVLEDRLDVTVGGRYTRDRRSAERNSTSFGFPVDVDVTNRQRFSNFSPSVNLSMQWPPDVMTYAKVSKGYKAGGSSEGAPDFTKTYDPEKVTSYELGLKSQAFDRMLTFNLSLFQNEFKDLQIDFVTDPADQSVVVTTNAGSARVRGFEADIMLQPTPDMTLQLSYSHLDPKIKSVKAPPATVFDPASNPGSGFQVGDEIGSYFVLPFAPRNALTLSGNWTFLRTTNSEFSINASYSYQEAYFSSSLAGPSIVGREFYRSDDINKVDARVSWNTELASGADLTVSVYAENLTNDRYSSFVIALGSPLMGYSTQTAPYNEPRTFGVEARLKF